MRTGARVSGNLRANEHARWMFITLTALTGIVFILMIVLLIAVAGTPLTNTGIFSTSGGRLTVLASLYVTSMSVAQNLTVAQDLVVNGGVFAGTLNTCNMPSATNCINVRSTFIQSATTNNMS